MEELTKELSRIQEECDALRMKLKASKSKVFSSHEKKTIHESHKLEASKLKVFSSHEKKTVHKITQTRGLQA